jgi:hypothetical protein
VASTLDGGLEYKSGIAAAIRPGVAGCGAGARRPLGCSSAIATRPAISSHTDATTPFTDGGWTAQ